MSRLERALQPNVNIEACASVGSRSFVRSCKYAHLRIASEYLRQRSKSNSGKCVACEAHGSVIGSARRRFSRDDRSVAWLRRRDCSDLHPTAPSDYVLHCLHQAAPGIRSVNRIWQIRTRFADALALRRWPRPPRSRSITGTTICATANNYYVLRQQ